MISGSEFRKAVAKTLEVRLMTRLCDCIPHTAGGAITPPRRASSQDDNFLRASGKSGARGDINPVGKPVVVVTKGSVVTTDTPARPHRPTVTRCSNTSWGLRTSHCGGSTTPILAHLPAAFE